MGINLKHGIEYQLRSTREGRSESLMLKRTLMGGDQLKEVLAVVREHAPATEVKQLNIHNAGISDADCATLCGLMACLPNLVAVEISENRITGAGLER